MFICLECAKSFTNPSTMRWSHREVQSLQRVAESKPIKTFPSGTRFAADFELGSGFRVGVGVVVMLGSLLLRLKTRGQYQNELVTMDRLDTPEGT